MSGGLFLAGTIMFWAVIFWYKVIYTPKNKNTVVSKSPQKVKGFTLNGVKWFLSDTLPKALSFEALGIGGKEQASEPEKEVFPPVKAKTFGEREGSSVVL